MTTYFRCILTLAAALWISGCSITHPLETGDSAALTHCPPTPNCASTESDNIVHRIEPFILAAPADQAWPQIVKTVSDMPRTTVNTERPGYLYAKSYSRVFHFVDYLEVLSVPEENRLAVRSSSMLGISDLGVNAKRTETLRKALQEKGIIE
ncbi:DUF1499 domain-containing protein [Kistimonas asteriae]|uniref:DUF1499 domain-containing protein n=1 Tax=Kistimonas asteriae TaxID=517724 RepID=UPI001BAB0916|nr:DUF1499 domain-containing protein [Kistimonas asteriae]